MLLCSVVWGRRWCCRWCALVVVLVVLVGLLRCWWFWWCVVGGLLLGGGGELVVHGAVAVPGTLVWSADPAPRLGPPLAIPRAGGRAHLESTAAALSRQKAATLKSCSTLALLSATLCGEKSMCGRSQRLTVLEEAAITLAALVPIVPSSRRSTQPLSHGSAASRKKGNVGGVATEPCGLRDGGSEPAPQVQHHWSIVSLLYSCRAPK